MSDDYQSTTSTTGRVLVGGTTTGKLETAGDRDWFAVRLEAGETCQFDLKGRITLDGTLMDPRLAGIYDASGNRRFILPILPGCRPRSP